MLRAPSAGSTTAGSKTTRPSGGTIKRGARTRLISRPASSLTERRASPLRTRVLQVDPLRPGPDAIEEAAALLVRGGLVAFATETVYGLGAVATDPAAVARIYRAKGRPLFNPLIVHVAEIAQAQLCAFSWPEAANRLA